MGLNGYVYKDATEIKDAIEHELETLQYYIHFYKEMNEVEGVNIGIFDIKDELQDALKKIDKKYWFKKNKKGLEGLINHATGITAGILWGDSDYYSSR